MGFKLLATILIILAVYPNTPLSQWLPRRPPPLPVNPKPLCALQLALVNRACALLPYAQVPPPAPPSPPPPPPAPEEGEASGHHHHHRQHHHRQHHHRQHHRSRGNGYVTAEEQECCRWLKEVDTVCVCEMLVHLPPFMTRPLHEYKVVVDGSCDVSFECASRLGKF